MYISNRFGLIYIHDHTRIYISMCICLLYMRVTKEYSYPRGWAQKSNGEMDPVQLPVPEVPSIPKPCYPSRRMA